MNETLMLVWSGIAIIGIIAVIIVKIYYGEKEEEEVDIASILSKNPLQEMISSRREKINNTDNIDESTEIASNTFSNENKNDIAPKAKEIDFNQTNASNKNISYSSQNQVYVNYNDSSVQKFQEPITETQRDIMSQNNKNSPEVTFKKTTESKHELKDLFTIDELIKESKRKDDEREKESKIINKEKVDDSDIKESIKRNKESSNVESEPIEEIKEFSEAKDEKIGNNPNIQESIDKVHEIANNIKTSTNDTLTPDSIASQKDIADAINSATTEKEEKAPEIAKPSSITDAVINKNPDETTVQKTLTTVEEVDDIKTPTLKTPKKVEHDSVSILPNNEEDYEFGASVDSTNLFEDENGELSDLDYRKDLAKLTSSIKNSRIVKDVRDRFSQDEIIDEDYVRNVSEYEDEYAPIVNETHAGYLDPTPEEQLRQENTLNVFNSDNTDTTTTIDTDIPEELSTKPKKAPSKTSLKVIINSNEEVLCKGDEIIFKHDGETYSSKVYAINGDDIKVRYRRKDITIKASDIKKIY